MTNCKSCKIDTVDPIDSVGNCSNGDASQSTSADSSNSSCTSLVEGVVCATQSDCSIYDITDGPESCLMSDLIEEQLNIAGTTLQLYKLLGIHEQGLLQDVTGHGEAISSGSLANNPASNAFDKYITEWKSLQTGSDVVQKSYIGYDFGPIRMSNGRTRYGITTEIMKDISTIKIMQGCDAANRVSKLRVERSENGVKWYGVAILNLENCDGILTLNFKRSVPSRYWRIRPISFNGGVDDSWSVRVLQFIEYEKTAITNIQDKLLLENRDRDYDEYPVEIKATYTPQEFSTQLQSIGFNPISDMYSFDVSFSQCIKRLGRPIVIGDIMVVESERQYSASLRPIDKYLEVTDVIWSATGFTPMWKPTVQKIIAKPVIASQETQDILGKLTVDTDDSGLFDLNDGNDGKKYQDYMDISDNIRSHQKKHTPEKGTDFSEVPLLSDELREYSKNHPNMNLEKFDRHPGPKGIDALPPNGLPYTTGDRFPQTPSNGDYHRLTYTNLGDNIPARLYRYSTAKTRWIYLETDRKSVINSHRPLLQEYIGKGSTATPLDKVIDELDKDL